MKPAFCIDPGHGGADGGAQVRGSDTWSHESELNLQLALSLHDTFCYSPLRVKLLRSRDDVMPLADRSKRANEVGASFVLSIHFNANKYDSDLHGSECYVWPGDKRSRDVAETLIDAVPRSFRKGRSEIFETTDNAGREDDWLQRPRYVVGAYDVPCVLWEVCYLTNGSDMAAISMPHSIEQLVQPARAAIVRAAQLYGRS